MGDCRLRIRLYPAFLLHDDGSNSSGDPNALLTISNDTWSSDTTVYDAFQQIQVPVPTPMASSLQSLIDHHGAVVWDCTMFPATNVSRLCRRQESQITTLFAAGWYPSGHLQILPEGTSPITAKADTYDDVVFQPIAKLPASSTYQSSSKSNTDGLVKLSSYGVSERPLPSHLLSAVPKRFSNDDDDTEDANARVQRHLNARNNAEAQQMRQRKLDGRIRRLRGSNNVSDQVRRMLIKSRATGRPDLLETDRIYLHCVVLSARSDYGDGDAFADDESTVDAYRYFSLQETIGRAVATIQEPERSLHVQAGAVEMLVLSKQDGEYRRLPSTLRFHEAVQQSFLTGTVDTVIVRYYDSKVTDATPLIGTAVDTDHVPAVPIVEPSSIQGSTECIAAAMECGSLTVKSAAAASILTSGRYSRVVDVLRAHEGKDAQTKPKKSPSATNEKVRQMKIKSKAIGDGKRIKLQDRFFLELVTVLDRTHIDKDGECTVLSVVPIFVALSDSMDRHVRCYAQLPKETILELEAKWTWDLLCFKRDDNMPDEAEAFLCLAENRATTANTWKRTVEEGTVKEFDRVVLRYFVAPE
jgi:hypothetical protein